MNLHEYQAKQFLAGFGLPILQGYLCHSEGDVEAAYDSLGGEICVIKAQVHAGGRGKGGGVKIAKSGAEARSVAKKILGMTLVTKQTGAQGKLVRKVYVEAGCAIDKEFYISTLIDRTSRKLAIVASKEGGMEIEEVAHNTPEKIITIQIEPSVGLQPFQSLQLALKLDIPQPSIKEFQSVIAGLVKATIDGDLAMLEINPLVLTKEGKFVLLDAKISVDDNALYRQKTLARMADYDEQDPKDLRAGKAGLSYVALDGNIGCLVNGAGLAMATMDLIKMAGGEPANFLDVGGGASKETVTEAFRILLSDSQVKAILVNIFGGIMKCDVIAEGIIAAAKELGVTVPLVVRLQGTNVELGRKLLSESGLKIIPADTMQDAAEQVVKSIK